MKNYLSNFQIIMGELYRNICLAFACIFVTTLLMLSDFLASVQVLLTVLFTLVNVGGSMYFWGKGGTRDTELKFCFLEIGQHFI